MTRNQRRAAHLAEGIFNGSIDAADLSDHDWHLLLLAAHLNNPRSLPLVVAKRVLDRAAQGIGYFAPVPVSMAEHDHGRSQYWVMRVGNPD